MNIFLKTISVTVALIASVFATYAYFNSGQNRNIGLVHYSLTPTDQKVLVKTELTGDGNKTPFVFSGTITNLSDATIEITSGHLELEKQGQTEREKQILGDNYWAPGILFFSSDEDHQKSSKTIQIPPKKSVSFDLKLNDLKWGWTVLSTYPYDSFGSVVEPNIYELSAWLTITGADTQFISTPVELKYERKKGKARPQSKTHLHTS